MSGLAVVVSRSLFTALLLSALGASATGIAKAVINLDLPPEERWHDFALEHRDAIINKALTMGETFEDGLGPAMTARWMNAAPVDDTLLAEYKGIVKTVNHSAVTLQRMVLTDMWHAVHSPSFECTGLLAATENGTVIHGRNIDYEMNNFADHFMKKPKHLSGTGMVGVFDGTFLKGGKPIVQFLATIGSLGIHTGMRYGAWSFNSNARIVENDMRKNLNATEHGSKNFPWVARKYLEEISDFDSALAAFDSTNFNAPNYFILAGAGPYEGAIVTVDRGGVRLPGTPPMQRLNRTAGVWHLVQTNDDLLEPPLDARRGAALLRLSKATPSNVNEGFVLGEMTASPVMNSDTLLTWVANPAAGTHTVIVKDPMEVAAGMFNKFWHRQMHLPMPQDLPIEPPKQDLSRPKAALRASLLQLHAAA
mmetsp:Transcript_97932/g.227087  ORF Transcript_97932/g.227087 Transcript_97932/m.227087 type:complete len:422 (+) Transcript_97932:56-1321(+)